MSSSSGLDGEGGGGGDFVNVSGLTLVCNIPDSLESAEKQYKDAFDDEHQALLGRIAARAKARLEEAQKEIEAEEREVG